MSEVQQKRRRGVATMLPLEWRERLRVFADAGGIAHVADDISTRLLALREQLKHSSRRKQPRHVNATGVLRPVTSARSSDDA